MPITFSALGATATRDILGTALPTWDTVVLIITGPVRPFGELRRIIEGDRQIFRLFLGGAGFFKLFVQGSIRRERSLFALADLPAQLLLYGLI